MSDVIMFGGHGGLSVGIMEQFDIVSFYLAQLELDGFSSCCSKE